MNTKISRRDLAAALFGSTAALAAAQAPSASEDLDAAAKQQIGKNAEELAGFDLPMSTEPAFQFKV